MLNVTRFTALVIIAIAVLVTSCEIGAPEDFQTVEQDEAFVPQMVESACADPMPSACLEACGLGAVSAEPMCRHGRWACSTGIPDSRCPDYMGTCNPDSLCGHGYTCVKSLNHPIPANIGICRKGIVYRDSMVESCSDEGMTSAADFVRNRDVLTGNLVKFSGRLGISMQCTKSACFSDNPCCATCVGNYKVEIKDPEAPQQSTLSVYVRTEALPCQGTNCSVTCNPLEIGESYRMWGLLEGCKGQSECTLLYMGACLL